MPIFFIILFVLYISGNIYIFFRGGQALAIQSIGVKIIASLIFWGGASLFFISFFCRNRQLQPALSQICHEVGTGWLIFTLYMVLLLLLFDLLRVINIRFQYSFYVSLLLTISLLSYGYYQFKHPVTKVINIDINKPVVGLPNTSLRIVAVSDIHLGYATNKKRLKDFVNSINAQHPDLILIGGDLIDNSMIPVETQKMEEELNQLKAPLGIYMVPGNHEYISNIKACSQFLKKTPIHLLRDSTVVLPGNIQIIGRDDRYNRHRKSLQELTRGVDPENALILLDHQPYELHETVANAIDLQFSGHTHHGQVWPLSLITDQLFEISYGYRKIGNSQIYVSSGLSLWGPPFRIGTDSELVVFDITFK